MSAHKPTFKNNTDFIKFIHDNHVQFIDMNFTDIHGKWHHITEHASNFDDSKLTQGVFFDGSSIPGWRGIEESDMILKPDIGSAVFDPFSAQKTLKLFCDVHDPSTGAAYNRDPRAIAKAAARYIKSSGHADKAYFGPELEFFLFENVQIHMQPHHTSFLVDSEELPTNGGHHYDTGNMGHRPKPKGGYVPESPVDSSSDIRGEMLTVMETMGLSVEKHHHEVAPAQCELGIKYAELLQCADNVQIYKHVVHNVAHSYGRTATFMPKPLYGDNGSGMHVHQSLWKKGKPIFAGNGYAGLSETALYYIGGIIKHARALNAFTNPSINSYKRLVPGYEAPVCLAYSAKNRSAACRIPYGQSPTAKRVEVRLPDCTANPYLAFSAMIMAGIDGIENKIDPGAAMDQDLYTLDQDELSAVPTVAHSLRNALEHLRDNHDFLLKNDVFTKDLIEAYIDLKMADVKQYETMVHPLEYYLYYSS